MYETYLKLPCNTAQYWNKRAEKYISLNWISDVGLLNSIFQFANPDSFDSMLDIGTGIGIIAKLFSPHVKFIDAIDISEKMLELAQDDSYKNIRFMKRSIFDFQTSDSRYDIVIARMTYHHLLTKAERNKATRIVFHILKEGGRFIIVEDIPPTDNCTNLYTKIFELKEKRAVFSPSDLVELVQKYFKTVETRDYFMLNSSVKNWMDGNSLSQSIKSQIMDLYLNADDKFKVDYGLKYLNNDIFLDRRFYLVKATK